MRNPVPGTSILRSSFMPINANERNDAKPAASPSVLTIVLLNSRTASLDKRARLLMPQSEGNAHRLFGSS